MQKASGCMLNRAEIWARNGTADGGSPPTNSACLFTALRDSEMPLWGAGSSLRRREEGPGASSNRIDPLPAGVEATGKSCPGCLWDLVSRRARNKYY